MAKIEQYYQKGKRFYHLTGYLGIDPLTNKQKNINRKGFKTKKEAETFYNKAKRDFEKGEHTKKAKDYTFKEVYNQWLPNYKNTVEESTYHKTVRNFENHILPVFSDYIISKITTRHVQDAVNKWHKEFKKYREVYNMVKRVLRFAKKHRYIKENPCDLVDVPTKKVDYGNKKTTKDFYTKNELNRFMRLLESHEDTKWLTCFRVFAFTGIRRGELLALTWDDVDFNNKTLSVNKALTQGENNRLYVGDPKNETSNRTIGVDDKTLSILKKWKHEQAELLLGFGYNAFNQEQLIFSQDGTNDHLNLSAPRNALARICKKHDVEMINIHGFRHTHCSLLFEAGVPMKDVQERLGHADIQTTMNIYTHVTSDSRKESAEKFASYINF